MGSQQHTPDDEDREDPERDVAPRRPDARPFFSLTDQALRITAERAQLFNKPTLAAQCRRELELRSPAAELARVKLGAI